MKAEEIELKKILTELVMGDIEARLAFEKIKSLLQQREEVERQMFLRGWQRRFKTKQQALKDYEEYKSKQNEH